MITVDLGNQMFTPLFPESKAHLYSHLVFAANGSAVNTTIVDGKILYRDREFTTIDEGKVLSEGERRVPRMCSTGWSSRPEQRPDMTPRRLAERTLVVGDPIVALGEQTLIDDGALDRRGLDDRRGRSTGRARSPRSLRSRPGVGRRTS